MAVELTCNVEMSGAEWLNQCPWACFYTGKGTHGADGDRVAEECYFKTRLELGKLTIL